MISIYSLLKQFYGDAREMKGKFNLFLWRPFLKRAGKGILLGKGAVIANPKNVSIGDKVIINKNASIGSGGEVEIGNGVFMNVNVFIAGEGKIKIGNYVQFGPNCCVV